MHEVLPLEQAALAHQKTTVGEMGKIALVPSAFLGATSFLPRRGPYK